MSALPKNVERGVELLDREYPTWREHIDAEKLSMDSCFRCILGQLYAKDARDSYNNGYVEGLKRLKVPSAKYGFSTWGSQQWENLTDAWKRALRRV